MKKVIGYVRVSSEIQKEKDNSVRSQVNSIRNWCDNGDYELVKIFKDEGVSGLKSNRDGLNSLFQGLGKNDVDVVVVYSLSRLGRKLVDVMSWIEMLEKKGIEFVSVKENFMSGGVMGKLLMGILGSVNEFEVGVMGERIRDVKKYKKSKKEVYNGKICYGWDRVNNVLIGNEYEMGILSDIYDLREMGRSYFSIAKYLNKNNIRSKNGGIWYSSSVRSVYLNGVMEIENKLK
jgi:site-specific DNA recombinase